MSNGYMILYRKPDSSILAL